MIKTETVVLLSETETGTDALGQPIVETTEVSVEGVIVGTPSFEAAVNELNLTGKRLAFILGIPKSDENDWTDKTVLIRGDTYKTYGFPLTQTEGNVPGRWNTQVKVERYE
jgi:hypothetical protein